MQNAKINDSEIVQLELALKTTGDARQMQRAQALIWLSEGDSVSDIAERLLVDRRTIYNWISRFVQNDDKDLSARLADAKRSGRPATAKGIIDPIIDLIIDSDPSDYGYISSVWTASLLQDYLNNEHQVSVSRKSIARALDRLGISWKRPRYRLSRRHPHWRQAKGGSKTASGRSRGPSS